MEDSSPAESREDRGPRIPPGKLATIKAEPTISIFYKPTKTAPLQLVDGKFPQDAAMVFCNRIRRELMDNSGTKSFTVTGGDLTGLSEVVAWIKQCVSEGNIVKYKDLGDDTPHLFTTYANVIISATYLGIPARDLAEGLTKRMQAIARKVLMSWEEVEWFYKSPTLSASGDSVREVAGASVFWAWWTGRLDDDETPDDMMFLDVLRQQIPKLDGDLHAWCERNEQEVRKKWELKKNGRAAENKAAGGFENDGIASGGGGGGWDDAPSANAAVGGGWDNIASSAAAGGGGNWDTGATSSDFTVNKAIGSDHPKDDDHVADSSQDRRAELAGGSIDDMAEAGGDWADEVNQHDTVHQQSW